MKVMKKNTYNTSLTFKVVVDVVVPFFDVFSSLLRRHHEDTPVIMSPMYMYRAYCCTAFVVKTSR